MTIYLNLTGIHGDVTSRGHENWLAVSSVNHVYNRMSNNMIAGHTMDRSPSAPRLGEFEVVRFVDKASPIIFQHFCKATNIEQVKIDIVKTNSTLTPYLQYSLTNVLVSSINRFHDGEENPIEVITLNYTKIEEKFTSYDSMQKAQSPVTAGYDLQTAEVL